MGDRIEIKDSVIMGNVSTGGKSSSRSECSICKKIGRFNLHFCKWCNVYFCRDCRDSYWKDEGNICKVCGPAEREARIDFVNDCYNKLDGKTWLLIGKNVDNFRYSFYSPGLIQAYVEIKKVLSKITIEEIKEITDAESTMSAKRACLELPREQRWSTLELARIEHDQMQEEERIEQERIQKQKQKSDRLNFILTSIVFLAAAWIIIEIVLFIVDIWNGFDRGVQICLGVFVGLPLLFGLFSFIVDSLKSHSFK